MLERQVDDYKKQLDAEKVRLEALIERTSKHLYRREEPYSADFAEQVVEVENNQVVEQLDADAQYDLSRINKALERIAQGSYGLCVSCGETIEGARLKAIPQTDECITCAEKAES